MRMRWRICTAFAGDNPFDHEDEHVLVESAPIDFLDPHGHGLTEAPARTRRFPRKGTDVRFLVKGSPYFFVRFACFAAVALFFF